MRKAEEERRELALVAEASRFSDPTGSASKLAAAAHASLINALASHGNAISGLHKQALRELVNALAAQAMSVKVGRCAYALPCGAGKTLSVVALIAAAHRLGYQLTFAVATSQIVALGRLRRDLVRAGVPADAIALRHSKTPNQLASLVTDDDPALLDFLIDTADDDRPIMLVSHARMRRGTSSRSYCQHKGIPRSLVIWDESLFVADAETLTVQEVKAVEEIVSPRLPRDSDASSYLASIAGAISEEVERQRNGASPNPLHLLRDVDNEQLAAASQSIPSFGSKLEKEAGRCAQRLLRMTAHPISVALTRAGASGEGLIRYSVAVPADLKNVAILDASHQIRLLAQSQSIMDATTEAMRNCKRYDRVQVNELPISAGKTTLVKSHAHREALAVQVANQIRQIPADEPVLIFTFKGDEDRSLQRQLKYLLAEQGINLDEHLDGKARISWLTWGSETSLNTFSHCKHVVLCGVLRRSLLDLAASAAGREDDLSFRLSNEEQQRLQLSEMCHCVMQAMSRGSCRIADADGQAKAMTLSIYGTVPGMEEMLRPSLPGVRWHTHQLERAESLTGVAAKQILAHLQALPESVSKISVSALRKALGLELGRDSLTEAVQRAVLQTWLPPANHARWKSELRSVVRAQ